jgi:diaminohydroxyphosphoribosylaminopyrimidine deaminase/5-amino-6-(5-phosphoribosylamino)uracil reductase
MENLDYVKLEEDFTIHDILDDLYARKVQSLIVEGGTVLLQHFISDELWDEARVFTGNVTFGQGIPAPRLHVPPVQTLDVMQDRLDIYLHQ